MASQNQNGPQKTRLEPPRSPRILRWAGLAALIVAVAVAATGILRRQQQQTEVAQWTQAEAIPTVSIVTPQQGVSGLQLVLPGDVKAWHDAPIYARVNGYLKNWYFNYGARVKTGQVLAEIEAPDLDGQLAAAQAKLNAANSEVKVRQAEQDFAKTTYERWGDSPNGVVSVQETQMKKGDYDSATARLSAAQAGVNAAKDEVDRLQALESFKRITVPFDGVVTERNTDIGALINAGSGVGGGSGPVLFRVADVHKMRIFVKVPQKVSAGLQEGMTAELVLPQYPDKTFNAVVVTTSRAIDMTSRTLLVELDADNPNDLLQPGTYAQVHFNLPANPDIMHVPTSALLFREHGLEVAVIGQDNKIELKKVTLGRNLGTQIEVLKGLTPSDRVVNSPPDSLSDGDVVHFAGEPAQASKEARSRGGRH
ncbi:MAG TPA: efflux RND transporter periplasmic adaptor subunit [Xanthobacteraceae bacterium]|nr:efflux RND transporter periplasmic adaptor subunit [Xanthobacteraceae bacterium]